RGVAGSTRGDAAVDIARLAADAWAVLDARLGGTWGGRNAYMQSLFAMRAALLAASPALYEQAGAYLSYPAAWLLAHPEAVPAAAAPWPAQRVAVVRERIAALLAYDRLDDLPGLDAPALVLGARDDQIVPFALQQQLARVLPGAQLRPLEHGGHFFPIVRGADYVAALLDWFGHHSL
ncbi:alpha/beta fold hydrolase, partial [Bordetella pertussis]|uniref:alpha/beta fold hydrolase n=1 Tax=Bordetella pertussis TaxID=520 RepID=UPI00070CAAFA